MCWKTIEDLRPHLDPIVKELGHMPSANALYARQLHDLSRAISKFGGYSAVAHTLGYPYKTRNSWDSIEDVRLHLQPIVDELGRMPSKRDLAERGRIDLDGAIKKFGGVVKVAELLGYPYVREIPSKWKTVEDLRLSLQPIVDELRYMPSADDLRIRKRGDLAGAIAKFGGYPAVARRLGYPCAPKWSGKWKAIEHLRLHLQPIVDELGRMPTGNELSTRKRHDLASAIGKFGGYPAVAQALGYPYEGNNSWNSLEDVRQHLQPIVDDELGRMPSKRELVARGRIDLDGAIKKFGGVVEVAKQLGYLYVREVPSKWKSVEDLRPHLQPIVDELGWMPSADDLRARKRGDIAGAINKFGGYRSVAQLLGYPSAPGWAGKWQTLQQLGPHLQPIVDELGWMPTDRELAARGHFDLINAIRKFGGIPTVARELGYPYEQQHSWDHIEDLRPHLQPIVDTLGYMPNFPYLKAHGRIDLIGAISKFGGVAKVAAELGYTYSRERAKKRTTIEDLRLPLQPLIDELGRMPNTPELKARGRHELITAIVSFGGFASVAQALGHVYTGPTSWERIEGLRLHLDPIVLELGRMPTNAELTTRGRVDLTGAIRKFGGYPKVAEDLGYPYAPKNTWTSVEDLRPHLNPLVKEMGHMPTQAELTARHQSQLISIIRKFGGHATVAQALGYPYKGRNSYEIVEDLRPHLDPIVRELGYMPSQIELKVRGRYDLTGIIHRFGGQLKVAQALKYPYSRNIWKHIEDLRPYLDPIVEELGYMPTYQELEKRRRADLRGAVERFGGVYAVAQALGYSYVERNTWKEVEDLRPHLQPIVDELEYMPTQAELRARGYSYLIQAIKKFGGLARVAERLGYRYAFAPELERHARLKKLEEALLQLYQTQQLSAGQVMLLLRHAGVLSKQQCMYTIRRLHTGTGNSSTEAQMSIITATIENFDEEALDMDDPVFDEEGGDTASEGAAPDAVSPFKQQGNHGEEESVGEPSRNRTTEIKELRGWSAVGNLLDPTPALIQLSVTRLKTAFCRFANQQRGSLEAPHRAPTEDEVEQLKRELWKAAFGEYEALITNELIREACQTYITDLAEAFLLPRIESQKVPRLYQLDGAHFLAQRLCSETLPYGLLFDQPGMGKTLTLLWALAAAGVKRFLVVAPLTVKNQVWTLAELQVAFPELEEAHVARNLDAALGLARDDAAVVLLHYEDLRRHKEIQQLTEPLPDGRPPFEALVFDEAHTIKERLAGSPSEQRTGAWLLRKGARACIGLTATPLVNELYEPISLLHLVQGRQDSTTGKRLQSRRLRDRVDVMEYLLTDTLRRLKSEVLFEIPPRQIDPYLLSPTAEQLERILHFLGRGRRVVSMALAEYRRLMLACKLDWIVDRVSKYKSAITSEGHADPKVLILCYNVEGISHAVYSRLVAECGGSWVAHIDGTTPQEQREAIVKHFQRPTSAPGSLAVLVGTVGTIGVGVTLFDATAEVTPHRVIFADLPFTWAEFEQGVDRLHRVGQRYQVQVDVPLVTYSEQLLRADGAPIQSFDEWVWEWICRKQVLADQVLDAGFDISEYKVAAIRRAIAQALKDIEQMGGTVIAPPPPPDSASAEHRRLLGRYRGLRRQRVSELLQEPGASEQFLARNDASRAAKLAQRLVRERVARWLDTRSVVIDLGCGSNPLRDLPCAQVIGIDRHGVNGGLVGDSADTGLPGGEADFVVFSLSMWGTPEDRLCYLWEAKRLLRPIGKLIMVEPAQTFGGPEHWRVGVMRLSNVLRLFGMRLASAHEYTVDTGSSLIAIVANNSNDSVAESIHPDSCIWTEIE